MIYQKFNKRSNAYVKMQKSTTGKTRILNVKQKEPLKPFKGVKVKKN